MNTTNKGIDYGLGQSNIDPETGIRFGVIPSNSINPDAFEDIVQHGTDLDYKDFIGEARANLRNMLADYISDFKLSGESQSKLDDVTELAWEAIEQDIADTYEQSGDCTCYLYERDGYKLQVASNGDIFVLRSPFYTHAQFCSPCAPGACYLLNHCPDGARAYCLRGDWFDDQVCPYPVYEVATGKLLTEVA